MVGEIFGRSLLVVGGDLGKRITELEGGQGFQPYHGEEGIADGWGSEIGFAMRGLWRHNLGHG